MALLAVAATALGILALYPPPTAGHGDAARIAAKERDQAMLVVIDGLPAPVARDAALMPNWNALAARGASGIARTPFGFSVTGASVFTLLTGADPGPLSILMTIRSTRTDLDTIFDRCHAAGRTTGVFGPVIWRDIAGRAAIDVMRSTGEIEDVGDCVRADQDTHAAFLAADPIPDLAVVHFYGSDHAGHRYRREDPRYKAIIAGIDRMVGDVLARVPDRAAILVADHGMTDSGAHGGPEAIETDAPVVLAGPGFAHGMRVRIRQVEIAPTLAAVMGVEPPRDAVAGMATMDAAPAAPRPAPRLWLAAACVAALLAAAVAAGPVDWPASASAVAMALLAAPPQTRAFAAIPVVLALAWTVRTRGRIGWGLLGLALPWAAWLAWGGPAGWVHEEGRGLQEFPDGLLPRAVEVAVLVLAWARTPGRPYARTLLALAAVLLNPAQFVALAILLWGATATFIADDVGGAGAIWVLGATQYLVLGSDFTFGRVEMALHADPLLLEGAWTLPFIYAASIGRYVVPWLLAAEAAPAAGGLFAALPPFMAASALLLAEMSLVAAAASPAADPIREGALQVLALLFALHVLVGGLGAFGAGATAGAKATHGRS